jgi:hypothetical protein
LAANTLILHPIDNDSQDTIYLFTDASHDGTEEWVGQQPTHEIAQPVAFHSRKFQTSLLQYPVHELETSAIVYAIQAFHSIFSGTLFIFSSDNKSLS